MVLSETIKVELIYTDLEVNKVGLFSKIQEFDTVIPRILGNTYL